jgi:hypothetical protein
MCNFDTETVDTYSKSRKNDTKNNKENKAKVAIRYGLDGPGDQIPVGADFRHSSRSAHPNSLQWMLGLLPWGYLLTH